MEGRPSAAIWVSWYMILIYKESINEEKNEGKASDS